MIFGTPLEKTVKEISQKVDDLKSQRKLVELDLEKRILVLENTTLSLQKLLGSINDFESAKDTISKIEDMHNKLRDIEDTALISRLETVQSDDRLALFDEGIKELKQKVALLTDAIDILGESHAKASAADAGAKANPKEIASMKAELTAMKEAISRLEAGAIPPKKLESLEDSVEKNQSGIQSVESSFSELTATVREKIGHLERSMKNQKLQVDIPESIGRDILSLQKDVGRMKDLEAQLVRQIEADAKKLQELKSLRDERKDYNSLINGMEGIRKNVALLKKEMDLDRTMYPENIMRLEREMAALKGTRNDAAIIADVGKLAESVELIVKEQKALKEKMPKYENTIDSLIKNNDALKSGVSDAVSTVKQALSENAELKKRFASFGNSGNNLGVMAKTVDLIGNELSVQNEKTSKAIRSLEDKIAQLESAEKQPVDNVIEKMETDIRILRKELSVLKDAPQVKSGSQGDVREIAAMKKNLSEMIRVSETLLSDNAGLKSRLSALEHANGTPEKEWALKKVVDAALKSHSPSKATAQEHSASASNLSAIEAEIKRMSSELKSISSEKAALKSELLEFKSVANNLMEANQQLAEGLAEARLEIDEMRQKQPIIID